MFIREKKDDDEDEDEEDKKLFKGPFSPFGPRRALTARCAHCRGLGQISEVLGFYQLSLLLSVLFELSRAEEALEDQRVHSAKWR